MTKQTYPDSFSPKEIWVLGAGRFGRLAVQRLGKKYSDAHLTVIDVREDELLPLRDEFHVSTCTEDAISRLSRSSFSDEAWIVPAVPVHVAFLWLLGELGKIGRAERLPVPSTVDARVPNPFRLDGTLYASFATFICPDSCNEPDNICTHTRKPRPGNLFELLAGIGSPGFEARVLRSLQLAPGVGGYQGCRLRELFDDVAGKPGKYLISTSCRCHGVIDALDWNATASIEEDQSP
jgi:hypothetical protein